MEKITILIPVYNEKDSLLDVIEKIDALDFNLKKEIILIDDYSTDGTRDLYSKIKHKVVFHDKNQGKGASLRTGLKEATGDIIIIQDADLEYNPEDYIPLVEKVKSGEADVVYGSRLSDSKNQNKFLLLSYLANITLSFLTRILFRTRISDMETCYKVFRADIIKDIEIKSNRFDFEPEITAKVLKKGIRYKEYPISYIARTNEEGKKIGWKDGVQAICTLIKYRFFE